MRDLLIWLAAIELLALFCLPLTRYLFPFLQDRGAGFSKTLAILLLGWVAWWLAWLGLMPFTAASLRGLLLGLFLCWGSVLVWLRRRQPQKSNAYFAIDRNYIVTTLFFWVAALFFAWVVSGRAAIYDTEKLSDFHFLRACMDSVGIPPVDLWFGGAPINYYYFGYSLFAALGLLSGIDAPIVYNLAVVTVAALTASGIFSLGWSLTGKKRFAGIAVLFALILGNPHGVYDLYVYLSDQSLGYYSFWDSSRAVSQTITEFPFFSIYLGDLHPHYIILPWLTLMVVTAWALMRQQERRQLYSLSALAALLLGMTYATNTWNYPVVGLLIFTAGFFRNRHLLRSSLWAVAMAAVGALLFLPFHKHYHAVGGAPLRWLPREVTTTTHEFIAAWGHLWVPLLLGFAWLLALYIKNVSTRFQLRRLLAVAVVLTVAALIYKPSAVFALLILATAASGVALVVVWKKAHSFDDRRCLAVLLLFFVSAIGLFMESAFFDDLYDNDNFIRGNTVFKFSFLYFILIPPLLVFLLNNMTGLGKRIYGAALLLFVLLGAVYPIFVVRENIIYNDDNGISRTLDGAAFMRKDAAAEYRLVEWLRTNLLHTDAVILERIEESHRWGGRLAAFSGVNSALNWAVSQGIWRGNAPTIKDMQRHLNLIYNGDDDLGALQAITRYRISHVVIAPYEQKQFKEGMPLQYKYPVVYDQDGIKVYQTRAVRPLNSAK